MDEPRDTNSDPDEQKHSESRRWSQWIESLLIVLIVLVAIGFVIAQYKI